MITFGISYGHNLGDDLVLGAEVEAAIQEDRLACEKDYGSVPSRQLKSQWPPIAGLLDPFPDLRFHVGGSVK